MALKWIALLQALIAAGAAETRVASLASPAGFLLTLVRLGTGALVVDCYSRISLIKQVLDLAFKASFDLPDSRFNFIQRSLLEQRTSHYGLLVLSRARQEGHTVHLDYARVIEWNLDVRHVCIVEIVIVPFKTAAAPCFSRVLLRCRIDEIACI
jgi:hypothetical protein